MSDEEEDEYYTIDYVKNKMVSNGNVLYLVKWKEFDDDGCTWEPAESFEGVNYCFIEEYERLLEAKRKKSRVIKSESPSSTSAWSSNSPLRGNRKKTPTPLIKKEATTDDVFTQICPVRVKVKDMEVVESESEENISDNDVTKESQSPSRIVKKEPKVSLNQINEANKENELEERKKVPIKDEPMKEIAKSQNKISPPTDTVHGVLGVDTIDKVLRMKPIREKDVVVVELSWKVRKDGMKPFNSFYLLNDVRKVDSVALCDFFCNHIALLRP